jgi:hypothetical protein
VLKPTGSLFVNLGDTFANDSKWGGASNAKQSASDEPTAIGYRQRKRTGIPAKSRIGAPWRYAIRCIDELGLILRADIIWSKPNCLSGGAMVYARISGRETAIKVHDLCRAYNPDDVQLWNGHRWTQVVWWQATGRHPDAVDSYTAIRTARRRGETPDPQADLEIELRSGERIGCTRDHRWPTRRGLVAAANLVVGDILDTAPLPEGGDTPTGLDDEMVGWFVGLYIAEGSRSAQTIQIAGHVNELDRYKRLCELAEAFHGTCNVYPAAEGNGATITLTGRMLHAILDTYVGGRIAKDKHLHPKAWRRSNRFLSAVLDGYLSGDGHFDVNLRRWSLGFTTNDALASDLRTLAARLGHSVRLRRGTVTGFGREWPAWLGTLYTDPSRRKQPDSQVVAIRQSRARQCWDIGVADDPHLFALASGVLTHNSLPESVTDRVRMSHEYLFHFTRQGRYFAALDEVREPHTHGGEGVSTAERKANGWAPNRGVATGTQPMMTFEGHPLGKAPGSVWTIPSEPLRVPDHLGVDHFAAYPSELVRRCVLGWTPSGWCTACGEARRPVVDKTLEHVNFTTHAKTRSSIGGEARTGSDGNVSREHVTITGYACACPTTDAPTTPAVVLDPFTGTGTTVLVADQLGRHAIGVDLSNDYLRLAEWRIRHDTHTHRKVRDRSGLTTPQPPKVDGQLGLFGESA